MFSISIMRSLPGTPLPGGNPDQAASYTCRNQPHFTNPFLLNGQHG